MALSAARPALLAAAAAAVCLSCAARSDRVTGTHDSGIDLLRQAEIASATTDYDGTIECKKPLNGRLRSAEVRVYFHHSGLERMEYRSGTAAGLVVLHDRRTTIWYRPGSPQALLVRGQLAGSSGRALLLEQNYLATVRSGARIAGRDALMIDLTPRHPGAPRRQYAIDAATHVLLGQEQYLANGALKCASYFQSVEFRDEPASLFEPPRTRTVAAGPVDLSTPRSRPDLEHILGIAIAAPRWLPKGYRLAGYFLTRCESSASIPVGLSRFTDGADDLYLFQCRHVTGPIGAVRVTNHGSLYEVRLARQGVEYILLGDETPRELSHIAQSLPSPTSGQPAASG